MFVPLVEYVYGSFLNFTLEDIDFKNILFLEGVQERTVVTSFSRSSLSAQVSSLDQDGVETVHATMKIMVNEKLGTDTRDLSEVKSEFMVDDTENIKCGSEFYSTLGNEYGGDFTALSSVQSLESGKRMLGRIEYNQDESVPAAFLRTCAFMDVAMHVGMAVMPLDVRANGLYAKSGGSCTIYSTTSVVHDHLECYVQMNESTDKPSSSDSWIYSSKSSTALMSFHGWESGQFEAKESISKRSQKCMFVDKWVDMESVHDIVHVRDLTFDSNIINAGDCDAFQVLEMLDLNQRSPTVVRVKSDGSIASMLRTIRTEFPDWDLTTVVVPETEDVDWKVLLSTLPLNEREVVLTYPQTTEQGIEVPSIKVRRLVDTNAPLSLMSVEVNQPPLFHSDGVYIISGGLGYVGRHLGRALVENDAGRIVALSRFHDRLPDDWDEPFTPIVERCDVSDVEDVRGLSEKYENVRGVIHAAGVLVDKIATNLTKDDFEMVYAAKVSGARNLINEFQEGAALDFVVLCSSIASGFGSPGQANYGAANGVLDEMAHQGRSEGLPIVSIRWGTWLGGSMAREESLQLTSRMGLLGLEPEVAVNQFLGIIRSGVSCEPVVTVTPLDRNKLPSDSLFAEIRHHSMGHGTSEGKLSTLVSDLRGLSDDERDAKVDDVLHKLIEDLGFSSVSESDSWFDIGLDSLSLVEFRNLVAKAFKPVLISDDTLQQYPNIGTLQSFITSEISEGNQERSERELQVGMQQLPKALAKLSTYPLSKAQQGMWILHQLAEPVPVCTMSIPVILTDSPSHEVLDVGLRQFLHRHLVFCTKYETASEFGRIDVSMIDSASVIFENDNACVEDVVNKPFNLDVEPAIRVHWFSVRQCALLVLHHVAVDGASIPIIVRDLAELWSGVALAPPRWTFLDFAYTESTIDSDTYNENLSFWKTHIGNHPPILELPRDFPMQQRTYRGALAKRVLIEGLETKLAEFSKTLGISPFIVHLFVYQLLLQRYSGQGEVLVGVLHANRSTMESAEIIGMLAETIMLRLRETDKESSTKEELMKLHELWKTTLPHHRAPFDRIIQATGLEGKHVLKAMMSYAPDSGGLQHIPLVKEVLPNVPSAISMFDITLNVFSSDTVSIEYSTDMWRPETAEMFLDCYTHTLSTVCKMPDLKVRSMDVVEQETKMSQLEQLCGTLEEWSQWPLMHQYFEQSADDNPDKIALAVGNTEMSYADAERRSNQLAHYLIDNCHVALESCVGVLFPRGIEQVIAVLGILKAGGAYIPLDTHYPAARLQSIASDADMAIVLTNDEFDGIVGGTLDINAIMRKLDSKSSIRPQVKVSLDNLAYVLFTSGSTGRPKGVEVTHRSVSNFGQHIKQKYLPVTKADDRVLQVSRLSWDVSVGNMLMAFAHGSTLCMVPPEQSADLAANLESVVAEARVTRFFGAPSTLVMMDPRNVPTLKHVICGGDVLRPSEVARWKEHGVVVTNSMGPTECTITVVDNIGLESEHETDGASVPMGRPISNTRFYILDNHQRIVPPGVPGELYIAGACLSRGYRNLPEKNSECFLDDLMRPGERVYRTGDLVKLLPNGQIVFVGRVGTGYVKLRGFRVEPGEVSAVLLSHDNVKRVEVVIHKERQQLFSFVECSGQLSESQLLDHCRSKLTDYMIPAKITILSEGFPLDQNGKIDRNALLMMCEMSHEVQTSMSGEPSEEIRFPTSDIEMKIASIWREVLGISNPIGVDLNFFEMGGHSILAAQAISRMRTELEVPISTRLFFEQPTVVACAALASTDHKEEQSVEQYDNHALLNTDDVTEEEDDIVSKPSVGFSLLFVKLSAWFVVTTLLALTSFPAIYVIEQLEWNSVQELPSTACYLFVTLIALNVAYMVLAWLVKWLLVGELVPGRIECFSALHFRVLVFDRLWFVVKSVARSAFGGTMWLPWFYSRFGARVGSRVFIEDADFRVPDMIRLGDRVAIESEVSLMTFTEENCGDIVLQPISIGSDSVIAPRAVLDREVTVGARCKVCSLAHVPAKTNIQDDSQVAGTAAKVTALPKTEVLKPSNLPIWLLPIHLLAPIVTSAPILFIEFVYSVVIVICVHLALTEQVEAGVIILIVLFAFPVFELVVLFVQSILWLIPRRLLLLGRAVPGDATVYSLSYYRRLFASKLFYNTVLPYEGTVFSALVAKLHGAKMGVIDLFTMEPTEPDLYKCGKNVFLANGVVLRNMQVVRGGLVKYDRIEIGENCMVLDRTVLSPGCVIEDNATIGAITSVDVGDTIKHGELVFGNPAIRRADRGVDRQPMTTNLVTVISEYFIVRYYYWLMVIAPVLSLQIGILYSAAQFHGENHRGEQIGIFIGGFGALFWCAGVTTLFATWLFKKLIIGKFDTTLSSMFRFRISNFIVYGASKPFLTAMDDKMVTNSFYRFMGASIGENSYISASANILETDTLEIGSETHIGEHATLHCHTFQQGYLEIKPVKVGKQCSLGRNSVVLAGCVVEDNVKLRPLTHVMPEETLSKGEYAGSPAEQVNWV